MKIKSQIWVVSFFCIPFLSFGTFGQSLGGWTWRNPTPQGDLLNSIVFAQGRFVAVGARGRVLCSTNGCSWEVSYCGTPGTLTGVVFGKDVFVTCG